MACHGSLGSIIILFTYALYCLGITFPIKYASDFCLCIKYQGMFKSCYRAAN